MDRRRAAREWARRNPETLAKNRDIWAARHPKHHAYAVHKTRARARGIEFHFTRDEWIEWWGDDYDKRGSTGDSLCMCRYNDEGPYAPDNVYKATRRQNVKDATNGLN